MKILVLEDNDERIKFFKEVYKNHELFITRNVEIAYNELLSKEYDILCLDHDLEPDNFAAIPYECTGYDLVKKIAENELQKNAIYYIHSMNPSGANAMLNLLKNNNYEVQWIPFHLFKLSYRT